MRLLTSLIRPDQSPVTAWRSGSSCRCPQTSPAGHLAGMAERFATTLDCADITFIADGTLDELPLPTELGRARVTGVDLNKPRIRAALSAALALAAAPRGFTVAEFTARVQAMNGPATYTTRQAAYDLRKLRGKNLIIKPGRSRRYQTQHQPPAPSPPCSPSATRSSPPSWPASATPSEDASPPSGLPSTATTRRSASACRSSSTTSGSQPAQLPPHRQHFVDRRTASF